MWTKIDSADKTVTGEQSFDLLRCNAKYKLGAWQVACNEPNPLQPNLKSECYPVFQMEIPAAASTPYLKLAIGTISAAFDDVADDWTPKGWMYMKPSHSEL
jgi:hypothetical protein